MIPEIGLIALFFATATTFLITLIASYGLWKKRLFLLKISHSLSYLYSIFIFITLACLIFSFIQDDFSVAYVAQHSNTELPLFYKIAATWGGHEGSILFWLFSLALFSSLFTYFSRRLELLFATRTVTILASINLAFCLFILLFSSPFERLFPVPPQGQDLNPMLQDLGLVLHPPLLYLGYVGLAINFAMVISALLGNNFDASFARYSRIWILISWVLLTAGISLGSWWAYYELGWGGWWFWDPVENAALMPWLLTTALLHTLIVSEQRGILFHWVILLSIFSFSLSLLGTFIVRSGILTSVHAFAVDPTRGEALLTIFSLFTLASLILYVWKINLIKLPVSFTLFSKESAILFANTLFTLASVTIFIGTFYPLFFTLFGLGSISVGAPYFNKFFLPLLFLACVLMSLTAGLHWKQNKINHLYAKLALLFPAGLVALLLIYLIKPNYDWQQLSPYSLLLLIVASWLILSCIPLKLAHFSGKRLAMILAHCGIGLTIIGAVFNSYYGTDVAVRLHPQQQINLADYQLKYQGSDYQIGKNYTTERAIFTLNQDQPNITTIIPEKRYYDLRQRSMNEVGITTIGLSDIYIVMGDKNENQQVAFHFYYNPLVRLIWLGAILALIGGLFAFYRITYHFKQTMRN
ncbi:heme lyase NrfEFG subunit NrfE [Mergibacter septicus]|uniref:Heme lyase NrfEFG subunit NrfE n=1 Tax=Mergibacter septicus TaxID=221402 RepID=A0A8D4LNM9_9PAST|nr:heme lyase CcmF/NrfE family subunit [Mergibacter septicus]AWX16008.1 heme lyase NrfEFG subunit NrfE [Mergibacter septicus]QDJ15261.1 heme lyase NrfEFG subunit NrfE [Mergibacter septicus]UTU47322.1 heme lyase CcmF/NrfE family subunit [Mergibacter septicus]WMR95501.1 heme lyase CcmF/NrfE family subunit [Mergibacter septicus]